MTNFQLLLQKPSASILFIGTSSSLEELNQNILTLCDLVFAEDKPKVETKTKSTSKKSKNPFDKYINNPDFFYLSVKQFDRKSIPVEELRNVIARFQFRPLEHDKKILFIEEAEHLGEEGQNTILKLLEEPLDDSVIILSTLNQNSLRETILSRCQKFVVNSIKENGSVGEVPSNLRAAFSEVEKIHKISETSRKYKRAEEFMDSLIFSLEKENSNSKYSKLKNLMKYRGLLSKNANLRLVLENGIIEYYG